MKSMTRVVALVTALIGAAAMATAHEQSAGLHGTMEKGMKDMQSMKMSGDVDHDFMTMMKMHHEQGIEMARIAVRDGKDATAKEFARKVISAQEKDIQEIETWLKAHPAKAASSGQPTHKTH